MLFGMPDINDFVEVYTLNWHVFGEVLHTAENTLYDRSVLIRYPHPWLGSVSDWFDASSRLRAQDNTEDKSAIRFRAEGFGECVS